MNNPFDIISAELMEPQRVGQEFVMEHTEHSKLAAFTHTIVWGSRGSGKSMHFRFLEPLAQASRIDLPLNGDTREYLGRSGAFIGVYINCREGIINRAEFKQVTELPNADLEFLQIVMRAHLFAVIMIKIAETVTLQMPWALSKPIRRDELPLGMRHFLGPELPETLGLLMELISRQSYEAARSLYQLVEQHFLALPNPPDRAAFPKNAPSLRPDLLQLVQFIQDALGTTAPFFLLFDEANEMCQLHMNAVASLIAERSQRQFCVKVASQLHGFTTDVSSGGASIDLMHDYSSLNLDELYTSHQDAYYGRIQHIVNTRLSRAGLNTTIDKYLPPNPTDVLEMERARKIAEARYLGLPADSRPVDVDNFVKKYAPAILFQELRSPKAGKSYAGFENVVHLSSGIVRSFLDCCSMMYSRYWEKNSIDPTEMPVSIQNDVIEEYSNDFIENHITNKVGNLPEGNTERKLLEQLYNLLVGLGTLFRQRLMDKASREPRIISVSLKDSPGPDLERVLRFAEREAMLHRKWYRSKRGDKNLLCYVLNRRLCPFFNLDLTGFQGRIEVSAAEMNVSLENPQLFATSILGRSKEDDSGETSQLTLFEW